MEKLEEAISKAPPETPRRKTTARREETGPNVSQSTNGNGIAAPSVSTPIVLATSSRFDKMMILLLSTALLISLGASAYLLHRLGLRDASAAMGLDRFERQLQRLDAGITADARRRHRLLGMRDEIMRANPRVGLQDAYRYANFVQSVSDRYPAVPTSLLLAVGLVESGYRADAVGPQGALGIYQIRPTTGRVLARTLGWEFSDELLRDPERSTEMAALHLDILYAEHGDPRLTLAEYHAGPKNAGLFREGASGVQDELESYIEEVMRVFERLQRELEGPDIAETT